jgi:hypothetical protein
VVKSNEDYFAGFSSDFGHAYKGLSFLVSGQKNQRRR